MNALFWNRRGAGNIQFSSIIHDYKRIYGFNILAIAEPRICGKKADKVIEELKFDSCFRIEAQGRLGGLWLLWNKGIYSRYLDSSIFTAFHPYKGERD
jgi:hypothetical protein